MGGPEKGPSILGGDNLPDSIFGKEMREKEAGEWEQKKVLKTEFVKMYSYNELGEKLRKLRPEDASKANKDWFTLTELNERLAKLREMEEKETESRMGGVSFRDLRESLVRLKEADANKKANSMASFDQFTLSFLPLIFVIRNLCMFVSEQFRGCRLLQTLLGMPHQHSC